MRQGSPYTALALFGFLFSSCVHSEMAMPDDASERPNILLISIDDLRPDLGSYGHPVAKTPSLDAFAKSSVLFEKAYSQQAVCGPSRAALLTGLRPSTTGIKTLKQSVSDTVPNITTLNKSFKQSGYETISIGKIYHHANDDLDGWSKALYDVSGDFYSDRRRRGIPRLAYEAWESDELLPDAKNVNHALKELERLSQQREPFFLAVGLHSPHLPFRSPKSEWDKYDPALVPAPQTTTKQIGAPDWAVVAWEIWNYDNLPPKPGPMPLLEGDQLRHGYLASISFADSLVGQVLEKVSALGLDDNTVVVIWSDHGYKLGDHGGWAKHSTVELDIHVPMMIRIPDMKTSGARTSALVESVDIYPTLIELAGIDAPHELEGASLLPLIKKPQRSWKEAVFSQFPRYVQKQLLMGETVRRQLLMGETVRTQHYRYTAWVGNDTGETVAQELYDHTNDKIEAKNVAKNSEYRVELDRHEQLRKLGWRHIRKKLDEMISQDSI